MPGIREVAKGKWYTSLGPQYEWVQGHRSDQEDAHAKQLLEEEEWDAKEYGSGGFFKEITDAVSIGAEIGFMDVGSTAKGQLVYQEWKYNPETQGLAADTEMTGAEAKARFEGLDISDSETITASEAYAMRNYQKIEQERGRRLRQAQKTWLGWGTSMFSILVASQVTPEAFATDVAVAAGGATLAGPAGILGAGAARLGARAVKAARAFSRYARVSKAAPRVAYNTDRLVSKMAASYKGIAQATVRGSKLKQVAAVGGIYGTSNAIEELGKWSIDNSQGVERSAWWAAFGFMAPVALKAGIFGVTGSYRKGVTKLGKLAGKTEADQALASSHKRFRKARRSLARQAQRVARGTDSAADKALKRAEIRQQLSELRARKAELDKDLRWAAKHGDELKGSFDPIDIAVRRKIFEGLTNTKTGKVPQNMKEMIESLAEQRKLGKVNMDKESVDMIDAISDARKVFGDKVVDDYIDEAVGMTDAMGVNIDLKQMFPALRSKRSFKEALDGLKRARQEEIGLKSPDDYYLKDTDLDELLGVSPRQMERYIDENAKPGLAKQPDAEAAVREADIAIKNKDISQGLAKAANEPYGTPAGAMARFNQNIKSISKQVAECAANPGAFKEQRAQRTVEAQPKGTARAAEDKQISIPFPEPKAEFAPKPAPRARSVKQLGEGWQDAKKRIDKGESTPQLAAFKKKAHAEAKEQGIIIRSDGSFTPINKKGEALLKREKLPITYLGRGEVPGPKRRKK